MKTWLFIFTLSCSLVANAAGDYQAGEKKAAVCMACHGATGVSSNPEWPNLAGQHVGYLIKQLKEYQQGHDRVGVVMTPMVSSLTRQDMDDLAEFYKNQPLPKGVTPKRYLQKGEQLYRGGDFEKHITACIACHGPKGTGNAQAGFPVLAGQHPEYLIIQMQQFKDGQRRNDLNSIMRDISKRMSADDIAAVAYYMAGLHESNKDQPDD